MNESPVRARRRRINDIGVHALVDLRKKNKTTRRVATRKKNKTTRRVATRRTV